MNYSTLARILAVTPVVTACLLGCSSPSLPTASGGPGDVIRIGHVYTSEKKPAAGAIVGIYETTRSALDSASVPMAMDTTDEKGCYEFRNLKDGTPVDLVCVSADKKEWSVAEKITFSNTPRIDTLLAPISLTIKQWTNSDGEIYALQLCTERGCSNVESSLGALLDSLAIASSSGRPYLVYIERVSPEKVTTFEAVVAEETLVDWGKVALARRDSLQRAYVAMQFGMLVDFNMSTFSRNDCPDCYSVMGEWGVPGDDVNKFKPTNLDCGQWAKTAHAAGCRYMILTVKHHDGFCLWPSAYSDYTVAQSSWGEAGRDVVKEFVDSARAYGLEVGFYYSMWDRTSGNDTGLIRGQIRELLDTAKYGNIRCLWVDGWSWMMGYRRVAYAPVWQTVKNLQPNCLIIENNHLHSLDSTEIMVYEYPVEGLVPARNNKPAECMTPLRGDELWFWHPQKACELKSVDRVVSEMTQVNAGNGTYLLAVTPDTTGLIPECMATRMAEIGQALEVYAKP